jgi:hypothetical protein
MWTKTTFSLNYEGHTATVQFALLYAQLVLRIAFLVALGLSGRISRRSTDCSENICVVYRYY